MKNFKRILLIFVMPFFAMGMFPQGYPVLDVANLMQSIESVYQYYQQIQSTIEQVQNTYTQIEQAAKQMTEMNWDDLSSLGDNFSGMSDNPFEVITGVRNSAQDITAAVNKNMNKVNDLQKSLTSESISFGGVDFSIADLCGAGDPKKNLIGFTQNAWDHTVESGQDAIAGYCGKLSYKERQAIARKYGMSAENYATIELANQQLSELVKSSNLMGTIQGQQQQMVDCEADANAISTLAKNLPDGSVFAATQLVSSGLAQTERMMGNMHNTITKGVGLFSQWISSNKAKESVDQQAAADKAADETAVNSQSSFADGEE